jgi:hypothetical protein
MLPSPQHATPWLRPREVGCSGWALDRIFVADLLTTAGRRWLTEEGLDGESC